MSFLKEIGVNRLKLLIYTIISSILIHFGILIYNIAEGIIPSYELLIITLLLIPTLVFIGFIISFSILFVKVRETKHMDKLNFIFTLMILIFFTVFYLYTIPIVQDDIVKYDLETKLIGDFYESKIIVNDSNFSKFIYVNVTNKLDYDWKDITIQIVSDDNVSITYDEFNSTFVGQYIEPIYSPNITKNDISFTINIFTSKKMHILNLS